MIADILRALQAGEELRNPEKWKKGQELTNLVGAVLAGVITLLKMQYPEMAVDNALLDNAAELIGTVLVGINLYLTRATTKKVGF